MKETNNVPFVSFGEDDNGIDFTIQAEETATYVHNFEHVYQTATSTTCTKCAAEQVERDSLFLLQ